MTTLLATPELHNVALTKLAFALKDNIYQLAVVELAVWAFGDLIGVAESNTVSKLTGPIATPHESGEAGDAPRDLLDLDSESTGGLTPTGPDMTAGFVFAGGELAKDKVSDIRLLRRTLPLSSRPGMRISSLMRSLLQGHWILLKVSLMFTVLGAHVRVIVPKFLPWKARRMRI